MFEIIFTSAIDDLIWMTFLIITLLHVIKSKDHRFVIPISLVILIFEIISSSFTNGVLIVMEGNQVLPIVLSISSVFILADVCVFIWIALMVQKDKKKIMSDKEGK